MPACARMGDPHACPITGHGITPIIMGSPNTYFDGQPAACVGHKTACGATIVVGFPKFTVNGLPVAYMGSPTTHGGLVIAGSPDIFAASMGGNPIDFQKMGAIDEAGELDKTKMAELLADPGLESKALMAGATVNLEAQTFHFLDPVMSIFHRRAAEIPTLSTTMARLSKQLKNEGNKLLDAENPEQGPPTKEEQDEDQLIVQVVGKEHNDDQRILICDEGGNKLGKTEERSKEPFSYQNSKTETESIDNELHIWPWPKDEPERVLKLEVQAICGGPIELPLMDKAIATYKRTARQSNVICPIVPASLVENARPLPQGGDDPSKSANSVLAKARVGFFYIFNHGKLWRELEIRQEEQNGLVTTYHDVRLSDYREGPNPEAPFKEPTGEDKKKREVVGKGLKDIWLPIQWNQRRQQIEVMYAETQLAAERLNLFERDPGLRKRRTQAISLNIIEARVEHEKYRRDIILGSCMPRVRPRSFMEEWELDFPAAYLLNRHGTHTTDAYKKAEDYQLGNMKPEEYEDHYEHVHEDRGYGFQGIDKGFGQRVMAMKYIREEPHLESGALSVHIQETIFKDRRLLLKGRKQKLKLVQNKTTRTPDEINASKDKLKEERTQLDDANTDFQPERSFWVSKHPVIVETDEAFYDARTRKIGVIQVEDSLYRARHLKERLIAQKALLEQLAALSEIRPHYKSAVLMDRYLAPKKIGGSRNPFFHDFKSLGLSGRQRLGYTLTKTERALASKYLHVMQEGLATWLKSHLHQYSLADLFSLSGADYMGAFKLTLELIQWAALPLHTLNPEDSDLIKRDSPSAQRWLYSLVTKRVDPLYQMLYPETNLEILKAPYKAPEQDKNNGDGLFRGKEVAELMAKPKYDEPADTIDGILLTSLEPVNGLGFSWTKNFNGFLALLHSNFSQIVNDSIESVTGTQASIRKNNALLAESKYGVKFTGSDADRVKAKTVKKLEKALSDLSGEWIELMSSEINRQRATFVEAFSEMVYKVTDGTDLDDKYVITIRAKGSQGVRKLHAEIYEQGPVNQLRKVVSTEGYERFNQRNFADKGLVEYHTMVVPKGDRMARSLEYIDELFTDQNKLDDNIKSLEAQLVVTSYNKPQLERQLSINKKEKARIDNIIENDDALPHMKNSVIMPSIIVGIELMNLFCNEHLTYDENVEFKGVVRAAVGYSSALIDTAVALEILATKVYSNNIAHRILQVGKDTPPAWWKSKIPGISDKFAKKLVRRITVGTVVGLAAGVLSLATNIMDACTEWNRRNYGAAIGYGMVSTGAIIGTASLFLHTKVTLTVLSRIPFIGGLMNVAVAAPWALIALALGIVGTAIIMYFDKSQLETWLDNGPFSTNPEDSDHPYLVRNQDEAFYRLFVQLVKPTIEIKVIPRPKEAFDKPNALIKVTNPLRSMGAMIDDKNTLNVKIGYNTCQAHVRPNNIYGDTSANKCFSNSTRMYDREKVKVLSHGDYNEYYVHIMSGCNAYLCPYSDIKRRNRIDQLDVWAQAYYYSLEETETLDKDKTPIRACPGLKPTEQPRTLTVDDIQDHTKDAAKSFWVREDKNQSKKALEDFLKSLEKESEPA